jgi:hypothetical protein
MRKHEGKKEGSPARRIAARRGDIFQSSGFVLGSSCDGMSTESDLAAMRLAKTLSPRGSCSGDVMPIKLLRVGAGAEGFGVYGRGPTAFDGLFGRPGEVGGRASRAELTECALRLCVCVERGGTTCAWSERVLVMEMVTERVSPAMMLYLL